MVILFTLHKNCAKIIKVSNKNCEVTVVKIIRRQVEQVERVYISAINSASRAIELLRNQITCNAVRPEEYNHAVMECCSGLRWSDELSYENYPLRFYSNDERKEIWLSGVESEAFDVLEMMGFVVQRKELEQVPGRILSFKKQH